MHQFPRNSANILRGVGTLCSTVLITYPIIVSLYFVFCICILRWQIFGGEEGEFFSSLVLLCSLERLVSRWAGRKISLKITNNSVFEQQEPITWKVYFDEVTEVIVLKYLELKMKIAIIISISIHTYMLHIAASPIHKI